jgi:hypothetical protein
VTTPPFPNNTPSNAPPLTNPSVRPEPKQ